ncbi:MAG: hypothetical protein IPM60_15480 [Rhodospirillales bacterium]|nr:hypothetical protein [Rhodospirillales bacterium]
MSALAVGVEALFGDSNLATDAVCAPGGGALDVRVVSRRPDEVVGFGDTRIHTATAVFDVRVSEVSMPVDGDVLEVGGERFVVQGEPVKDQDGLVWTLDVRLTT